MTSDEWKGETSCAHYRGIKFSKDKKCCGGKKRIVHRVDCAARNIIYGDDCRMAKCDRHLEANQ